MSIFFRDEAQVKPFLVFDKKKQRLKIHNGFDVPYERISLMKVHVWKDDEGGKYCSVRIQASNGPAVFDSTFFSNKTDGLGLGLFLSQNTVTRYGGSISLDKFPEGGTLTKLCLPINLTKIAEA